MSANDRADAREMIEQVASHPAAQSSGENRIAVAIAAHAAAVLVLADAIREAR